MTWAERWDEWRENLSSATQTPSNWRLEDAHNLFYLQKPLFSEYIGIPWQNCSLQPHCLADFCTQPCFLFIYLFSETSSDTTKKQLDAFLLLSPGSRNRKTTLFLMLLFYCIQPLYADPFYPISELSFFKNHNEIPSETFRSAYTYLEIQQWQIYVAWR